MIQNSVSVQVFECGSDQSSLTAEFCTYWSLSVAKVQKGGDKCMDKGQNLCLHVLQQER